jgi:hypothetical protein
MLSHRISCRFLGRLSGGREGGKLKSMQPGRARLPAYAEEVGLGTSAAEASIACRRRSLSAQAAELLVTAWL